MAISEDKVGDILIRLHALARKLEGEGQYNVAKVARAVADSFVRSEAYTLQVSTRKDELSREVLSLYESLAPFDLDVGLINALKFGASAIAEGRLTMFDETPHPYVCRYCGHAELEFPKNNCPRCSGQPRTFQQFPPVFWLEAMDPLETIQWLEKTPKTVKELFVGLSEDDLSREVIEGEWSIREILTHLRDAQGVLDFRINLLIKEDNPIIESKAVFEWAKSGSESPDNSIDIFETYHASRLKTLKALQEIALIDWWREGRHEEFGKVSIKQQVSYFTTHELTHLPQIESLVNLL
jgi:hypothetical protein